MALIAGAGGPSEQRFPFGTRIEIGRLEPGAPEYEGRLLVDDPTVSSLHCVVVRGPDGRLYARDSSRNGTWLDGRRLMPNREQEISPGQTLTVGRDVALRLHADREALEREAAARPAARGTLIQTSTRDLAVLVGDIRGYTSLVESVPGPELQAAVGGVFTRLARTIHSFGGQVKEYQGDSIMAFWEPTAAKSPAIAACRAAVALAQEVALLARDGEAWPLTACPLRMDWAVTTGPVSARVLGAERPEELSLVGEAVVLAYRLEKAADDRTGSPLTCARTRAEARDWFEFRDAGTFELAGFSAPVPAFRLVGEIGSRPDGTATLAAWSPRPDP